MRGADSRPEQGRTILDAAGQLFAERHYHEVRMEDIAARAGVAKGTLYLHFRCKDDLYVGLIRDGLARLGDRIEARLGDARGPEEKIRILVQESIRFFCALQLPGRAGAAGGGPCREGGDEALLQTRGGSSSLIDGILREFPGADRLSETDLRLGATALAGMLREVLSMHPQPWPDDLDERLTRLFVDGFRRTVPVRDAPA